jgi:acyl dehydratase
MVMTDGPTPQRTIRAADMAQLVGETFVSDWFTIDQARIDAFADVTNDHQWIHVDVERARREGSETIAHGFLTLSLFPYFVDAMIKVTDFTHALNYGFDKLRFTSPVSSGARIRMRMRIEGVEPRGAGMQMRRNCTIEVEGAERPAVIADWLALFFPK